MIVSSRQDDAPVDQVHVHSAGSLRPVCRDRFVSAAPRGVKATAVMPFRPPAPLLMNPIGVRGHDRDAASVTIWNGRSSMVVRRADSSCETPAMGNGRSSRSTDSTRLHGQVPADDHLTSAAVSFHQTHDQSIVRLGAFRCRQYRSGRTADGDIEGCPRSVNRAGLPGRRPAAPATAH